MGKVFVVLLVLVVCVVGLGFYLDWFHFTTTRDPESGKVGAKLEIDENKIKADADKAKQKIGGTTTAAAEKPSGQ